MKKVNLFIDKPQSAAWNMAFDEWLLVNKKPSLRFYSWQTPTVSLGYFQNSNEIYLSYIEKEGFQLVRRLTGGKAVFHHMEITYSVIAPTQWFPGNLVNSYKMIGESLRIALKELGIDANLVERKPEKLEGGDCFQASSWFEVTACDKKLIGSAQTRKKGWLLQHGSILLDINNNHFREIFRHNENVNLNNITISDILNNPPNQEEIITELTNGFKNNLKWNLLESPISEDDKKSIMQISERYESESWTYKR